MLAEGAATAVGPGALLAHRLEVVASGPPIVAVHGARTAAADLLEVLRPVADGLGRPLLAPSFSGPAHRGFQRLAFPGRPLGAADALEVALAGAVDREPFDLVGVSGGAQFAHRFALLFPDRVHRLVLVGAGWYTALDPDRAFPHGTGGQPVDEAAFLEVPTLLLVGERDVQRGGLLRTSSRLDSEQGEHRLARAVWWREHVAARAARLGRPGRIRLELLPGTGHSLDAAVEHGGLRCRIQSFLAEGGGT